MAPKKNKTERKEADPILPSNQQIPIAEALRLARLAGAIPSNINDDEPVPSTSSPASEIRRRKDPAAKPLISQIPSEIDGIDIQEIDFSNFRAANGRGSLVDEDGQPVGGGYDSNDEEGDGETEDGEGEDDYGYEDGLLAGEALRPPSAQDPEPIELAEEIFNASMLVIPLASLFLLLDMLAHKQYNRHPDWDEYALRLVKAVPTIAAFVFLGNRHPNHLLTNPLLMTASIFSGGRLIWLVNKASYGTVIKQAPPVGTLWVFAIVQLPLGRCVISLVVMLAWCWKAGMKFQP